MRPAEGGAGLEKVFLGYSVIRSSRPIRLRRSRTEQRWHCERIEAMRQMRRAAGGAERSAAIQIKPVRLITHHCELGDCQQSRV